MFDPDVLSSTCFMVRKKPVTPTKYDKFPVLSLFQLTEIYERCNCCYCTVKPEITPEITP